MKPFGGFREGPVRWVSLPEVFFSELLADVDDLAELKLTLYIMWLLERQEGEPRYLLEDELARDEGLLAALGAEAGSGAQRLAAALARSAERGVILQVAPKAAGPGVIFLNTARGRAAAEGLKRGEWQPAMDRPAARPSHLERPNIFALYEANIGALTPVMADILRDAEQAYPAAWIEEAIREAVAANARSWRYVAAILERWKNEGRNVEGPDSQKGGRRYVEGKLKDFIDH